MNRAIDLQIERPAHPLPEPPMTDQQLYDAMVHLSKVK
jgi:hypothetical protein